MAIPPVKIGDLIAEKYLVDSVIGEGGMGVVVAARHLQLDQRVAIKFLLPEIARQGSAAERFRREARSAARIRGEHVCRVLDVGTHADVPFMVMEFLEGCDLAAEIERRVRLPAEEAVDYVLQACEALAEAHVAGIVHRDLKPANLFLTTRSDGSKRVKVLDFGVSKSLVTPDSGQMSLTTTQTFVGSPFYMSPEQLDSAKDVDARTDIWALGVVCYELLTGRTPFAGESIPRLVSAVLNDAPPALASLGLETPEGFEAALLRALHKQRAERYATIAEFAEALAPFAPPHASTASLRVARVLAGGGATPSGAKHPTSQPSGGESVQRPATPLSWNRGGTAVQRSRRRRELAAGVGLLLLLLGVALYFVRGSAPSASTAKPKEHVVSIPPPEAPSQAPERAAAAPALPATALPSGVATPAEVSASAAAPAPPSAGVSATAPASPPNEAQQPPASSPVKPSAPTRALGAGPDSEPRHAPADRPRAHHHTDTLPDFGGRR